MPFFGLVCVASWVGCFFPSNQDLLRAPSVLVQALPLQATHNASGDRVDRPTVSSRRQIVSVLLSQQLQPRAFMQTAQAQALPLTLTFNTSAALPTSINFLGAFKNLFAGFRKFTAPRSAPSVVVTQSELKKEATKLKQVKTAALGFDQCASVVQGTPAFVDAAPSRKQQSHSFFQIKIKDYIVGSAPNQKQAKQLANRLEQALHSAASGNAQVPFSQLQPSMIKGIPGGVLGDRVLFTVDQQVADQWHCSTEALAIQWVNALRMALAEPPLALAEAQAKMRDLQGTGERLKGVASWYGPYFHGRQTATGETFNQNDFTAAHPSLPFDTYLRVTNLTNGKAVVVRINDRGPYFENRTLDLSREAARCLDSESTGVVPVEAEIMQSAKSVDTSGQAIARRL